MKLILASSSPYRKAQLERLALSFSCSAPEIDESPLPAETADQLASRLAQQKAAAVAHTHENAWVIGSDQVASLDQRLIGKPGTRDAAIAQLEASSGRQLDFFVGVCLMHRGLQRQHLWLETYSVLFKNLSKQQIERYVDTDKPFNCAGSFRSESLGVALFSRMWGEDPNTLLGLPLLRLIDTLNEEGFQIP